MKILAIESSCDESAISVVEVSGSGENPEFSVLVNIVLSQASQHAEYGGVYPSLAKREHEKNLPIILEDVWKKVQKEEIDFVAVTNGPGLAPALWVGVNFAKDLAKDLGVPLIPTNHMEGHIYSVFAKGDKFQIPKTKLPLLSLLISGGHTELVLSSEFGEYKKIGKTLDDAVGEAFDKVARLLDFPYPGGPHISKLAENGKENELVKLPRPMMHSDNFDFSFSGLKTSVLYLVKDLKEKDVFDDQIKKDIAKEFQTAVADVLVKKTQKAVEEFGVQTLVVAGGVSANTYILERLSEEVSGVELITPPEGMTGDNSLMIAVAGYFRQKKGDLPKVDEVEAKANLSL